MALINFYVFVRRTEDANDFLFLALYTVKLQLDGEEKISESCDSLSFIKDSVFGTSRCCCFLIVPKMVVFFVINSSANFRLVKNGNYQWSRCNLFQSTVAIDSSKHLPGDLYICFEWGLFLNMVFHFISIFSAHQPIAKTLYQICLADLPCAK